MSFLQRFKLSTSSLKVVQHSSCKEQLEKKDNIKPTDIKIKKFSEIPGPKSIPIFGTLYMYLPFIGKILYS